MGNSGHMSLVYFGRFLAGIGIGETVVVGPVADQAALHGLLQKLRDIGVTLISVNESEPEPLLGFSNAGSKPVPTTDSEIADERRTP